jgi:hypothetical protein
MFRKLDPFPSPGEGRDTLTLLGPLERTNLSHLTSFRNVTFSGYLEFRTVGKAQKPNNSEQKTCRQVL